MKELAYISTAKDAIDKDEIQTILALSQIRNAQNGLTGVLLYDGERFFQMLEGPDEAVDQLYANICEDERHKHVRTVAEGPINSRRFHGWSMAYRSVEALLPAILMLADEETAEPITNGSFGAALLAIVGPNFKASYGVDSLSTVRSPSARMR